MASSSTRPTFLIVDGNSLIFRAFHALPPMDANGIPTNALHGFLSMLLKVMREEKADYTAVCFDQREPTFRHQAYPEYKAGRAKTPPELIEQLSTIRELLSAMNIQWYALSGWEADDLLGTLALKGREAGAAPLLLTGDRDALQLVDAHTQLMYTVKGISSTARFTPEIVLETYGFSPEQVTDWKGLAGDSSDNIPGIPGVGDKTAVKLLTEYGSLENILAHAQEVKGKLGEKLVTYADQARISQQLATIRRDAPVDFSLEQCRTGSMRAGIPLLKKLQLNSIITRVNAMSPEDAAVSAASASFEDQSTVVHHAPPEGQTISYSGEQTFSSLTEAEAWLNHTASSAYPLAFWFGENRLSIADGSGRWCTLILQEGLMPEGIPPEACISWVHQSMTAHPAVVHHGKEWLHRFGRLGQPFPERFAWDTMMAAYLLNPQEKSYHFADLAPELPSDARGVRTLFQTQLPQITQSGMEYLLMEVELPLSHALARMEQAGFLVDREYLESLQHTYAQRIEALRQTVYEACGATFNLNSTQQLGEVLFDKLKLPHGKKTSRGYSTSIEVLESLEDIAPEIIHPLMAYRQLVKLQGTYVEGLLKLIGADGRIHSTFDQTGTATGRISSLEPNLQNIPVRTEEGKEIRRTFLPRPGWLLLDADYSQIELRLMAHFSGDEALVDAFHRGQDIHTRTASEIFDVPIDEVDSILRSRAKAVNFGLIYGISGFGLSRNTGVTPGEAKGFIQRYFQRYPGVKHFMDQAAQFGIDRGYAVTLMGRRRYLPELKSSRATIREFGKRAAMNTPVQGTAADIIKLAMVRVDRALQEARLQSRLILTVHDELLLECPPEEVETASRLLKDCMENAADLTVPLVAEVHQGSNWAEAK